MAVVSHRMRIVYLPIPKNACSTVKTMFFEAESGRAIDTLLDRAGRKLDIHQVLRSVPDGGPIAKRLGGYDVVAVLRSPMERFVSGYRNRILELADIEKAGVWNTRIRDALRARELEAMPDADSFAARLSDYMATVPIVHHHFLPQTAFVSEAVETLSLVVDPRGLQRIADLLAERSGAPVRIPHLQASQRSRPVVLSAETRARIRTFYAADYALLERFGIDAGEAD